MRRASANWPTVSEGNIALPDVMLHRNSCGNRAQRYRGSGFRLDACCCRPRRWLRRGLRGEREGGVLLEGSRSYVGVSPFH